MNILRLTLIIFLSSWVIELPAQDLESAKWLYDQGEYEDCLSTINSLVECDKECMTLILDAHFALGEVETCLTLMDSLEASAKKISDHQVYLRARCLHLLGRYAEAIESYKAYLTRIRQSSDEYQRTIERISRCLAGINLRLLGTESHYIADPGRVLNSKKNDFHLVNSPDDPELFYFSSNRFGLGQDEIFFKGKTETYDIFMIERVNGEWQRATLLNREINSPLAEHAIDIKDDELIFERRSLEPPASLFWTADRFDPNTEVSSYRTDWPYQQDVDDINLNFVRDDMIIFSSDKRGGYGGYDLYFSIYGQGSWTPPINFGPLVNSPFDEFYGDMDSSKTLYFSSDRASSIGGFDIFVSGYDEVTQDWQQAENAGSPINSPGDELYFNISDQDYFASLSSDRLGGQGQQDIYFVYDRKLQGEELVRPQFFAVQDRSAAPVSAEEAVTSISSSDSISLTNEAPKPSEAYLSPLFYKAIKDLELPVNAKEVQNVRDLMLMDSSLHLLIQVFAQRGQDRAGDLFFSYKPGLPIYRKLKSEGIKEDRMSIQGFGSYSPIISPNKISGELIDYADKMNSHIILRLIGADDMPIYYRSIDVRSDLRDPRHDEVQQKNQGVSFRIELFQDAAQAVHPYLEKMPRGMIEKQADGYSYLSGHFKSYRQASDQMNSLIKNGLQYCTLVAYHDGKRLSIEEALELSKTFPDLLDHIQANR